MKSPVHRRLVHNHNINNIHHKTDIEDPDIIDTPQEFCNALCNNTNFIASHIKAKLNDNLLIGTEHSKKIIPFCNSPNIHNIQSDEITDEEKIAIVLQDPKFGMFGLFKYHLTRGYSNKLLHKKNTLYCSHIFSLITALPILVFLTQWFIYIALMTEEFDNFSGDICPDTNWKNKMTMASISMLYFTRSFFLWDNLTDRTRLNKMTPVVDGWVMLDTMQEYGFNLLVYMANLWIVFNGNSVQDMILDSLAMEFVMNLDNEFLSVYFEYLPESAIDIYDNIFVTYQDNQHILSNKRKNKCFNISECLFYIPFKLLVISLMLFPVFSFFMIFYGIYCK